MAEQTEKAPAKKAAPKKAAAPAADKKPAAKKAEAKSGGTVTVTQIASPAGRVPSQRKTLIGLGLNKMGRTKTLEDTAAVRGMIRAVQHLVKVDEAA